MKKYEAPKVLTQHTVEFETPQDQAIKSEATNGAKNVILNLCFAGIILEAN